ncbi:MAG: N-acetylmuramoyl-L-alanine amidase [Fimbriimonadia bacterium]
MTRRYIERRSPNQGSRRGATVDTIVLHATGGTGFDGAVQWLCDPASRVSAHYVIGKRGELAKLVPLSRAAHHAGRSRLPDGTSGVNSRSIGIELVNRNDGTDPYPPAQVSRLKSLLSELIRAFPVRWLVSHAAIALPAGRKTDPQGLDVQALAREFGLDG